MLWAFCPQWLRDHMEQFPLEKYKPRPLSSSPEITRSLVSTVHTQGWPANSNPSIPLLYALAKAKSLTKGAIVLRPIVAVTHPWVQPQWMRIAARAFTLFLRVLVAEIPASFLHLRISDLAPWVSSLPSWGCRLIAEAGCTQQLDHVHPLSVVNSLIDAGKWLKGKRHWRATDMVWSVHRDDPVHDRPGAASNSQYDIISHKQLVAIVRFSMLQDIHAQSVGQVWFRKASIPMGGRFSAQGADLHSVWQLHCHVRGLHRLGTLRFSEQQLPHWDTPPRQHYLHGPIPGQHTHSGEWAHMLG